MPSFNEVCAYAVGVGTSLVSVYFHSYFSKKGENLATSEDIEKITRKIGEVNSEFTAKLEALAQSNKRLLQHDAQLHDLSMVAIEKRLEVHQEAFRRCFDLYFRAFDKDSGHIANEHLLWWRANSLYLFDESSETFVRACVAAGMHRDLVDKVEYDQLAENWARIDGAWERIADAVKLPRFGSELDRRNAWGEKIEAVAGIKQAPPMSSE